MSTFRWGEKPTSGNATTASRELQFFASGSASHTYVETYAYAATSQAIFTPRGTLYRQDIRFDWSASDYCNVTVPYGPKQQMPGSYALRYSTSGGTIHVTNSKSTVAKYPVATAPDMKGAIGVNGDDVEGTDVVTPALKITVDFKFPQGQMGLPKIKLLARRTAYVNSDPWLTFAPGEVLFLGADGEEGSEIETTASLQFAMSENAEDLTIGDIAVAAKQGHDYVWIRYEDAPEAGKPTRIPKWVYVERLYSRCSFGDLFGFGN